MKVLILTGFAESIRMYSYLEYQLKKCGYECDTFSFSTAPGTLSEVRKVLKDILTNVEYNVIYSHSMGVVLLNEFKDLLSEDTIIILDNPACSDNIHPRVRNTRLFTRIVLGYWIRRKDASIVPLLDRVSKYLVSDSDKDTSSIVNATFNSNTKILASALTLLLDRSKGAIQKVCSYFKNVTIIESTKDKIVINYDKVFIPNENIRIKKLPYGHALIVDNPDALIDIVKDTITYSNL